MSKSFALGRALALTAAVVLGAGSHLLVEKTAFAAKPKAAKQPIAVGQITGAQGPKVRGRVLDVLRKSDAYELTDAEDVKPSDKPATFASTASALQADAVIVGTVTKKVTLVLTVYGADGAKIDSVELEGGTFPKLFKAIDNELEIAIADPLASAKGKGGKGAAAVATVPAGEDDSDIEITDGSGEEAEPAAPAKAEKAPKKEEAAKKGKAEETAAKKGKAEAAAAKKGEVEEEAEEDALEEEETPAAASEDEPASEPSEPAKKGRRPLEAIAGLRGYNRKFNYTDTTDANLHSYAMDIAPALLLTARVYPGAFFRDDFLSHIGVQLRYEIGIPTTTQYPVDATNVAELKTKSGEWQFGLRGRFPLGPHELGTSLSYGSQWFKLKGDEKYGVPGAPYAVVPDVEYRYVRASIEGRFYIKKWIVGAHFAPRFVTSLSELDLAGVWFPGATGSGIDFGVMGGWQLMPILAIVGGIDATRYGFDFNNIPDDNRVVAGGATDTYLSVWAGAMFTLDGKGGISGASAEASTD